MSKLCRNCKHWTLIDNNICNVTYGSCRVNSTGGCVLPIKTADYTCDKWQTHKPEQVCGTCAHWEDEGICSNFDSQYHGSWTAASCKCSGWTKRKDAKGMFIMKDSETKRSAVCVMAVFDDEEMAIMYNDSLSSDRRFIPGTLSEQFQPMKPGKYKVRMTLEVIDE